jgi:glycosyltransferase involved in cell wall biosynthesis
VFEISIIVPVYKMKGTYSQKFLVEFLSHLCFQSFKDFQIVIPDQSEDNDLKEICDAFSYVLNIKHVRNTGTLKTAAANVNFGIKHADGKYIKLLYVDDFFVDQNALLNIKNAFEANPDKNWLISGFVCCNEDRTHFFNPRTPWYGNKYPNGDNTTGNPSTYSVRKENVLEMDENLLWIVDGEYFYRSYYHYGDPIIIKEVQVCFREHTSSAFLDPKFRALESKERAYVEEKYKNLPQRV